MVWHYKSAVHVARELERMAIAAAYVQKEEATMVPVAY